MHLRRLVRRLRLLSWPDVHAGPLQVRRRHRRAVQHQDFAGLDPGVLGSAPERYVAEDRRRGRGHGLQREDLTPLPRGQDHGAAPHRPGRERPAREAGRGRPDRVLDGRQGHSRRVCVVSGRRAWLGAAAEPH